MAVLGILVLIYLSVSLYQIFGRQTDLEKARTELSNIVGKIDAIQQQPNGGSFDYLLLTPQGWALAGWPYKDVNVASCAQQGWQKCLCICYSGTTVQTVTPASLASSCDKDRVCLQVPGLVKTLEVNPKSDSYFSIFNSDLRPIYIGSMKPGVFGSFNGNLRITYNKTLQDLTIEVQPT